MRQAINLSLLLTLLFLCSCLNTYIRFGRTRKIIQGNYSSIDTLVIIKPIVNYSYWKDGWVTRDYDNYEEALLYQNALKKNIKDFVPTNFLEKENYPKRMLEIQQIMKDLRKKKHRFFYFQDSTFTNLDIKKYRYVVLSYLNEVDTFINGKPGSRTSSTDAKRWFQFAIVDTKQKRIIYYRTDKATYPYIAKTEEKSEIRAAKNVRRVVSDFKKIYLEKK